MSPGKVAALLLAVLPALAASGCGSSHPAPPLATGAITTVVGTPPDSTPPGAGDAGAGSSAGPSSGSGSASTTTVRGGAAGEIVTAASGGLDVKLTLTPMRGRVGSPIAFSVTATAAHAGGALGYQLSFGDGTTSRNPVPGFCVAGNGTASQASWSVTHSYSAVGTYQASLRVYVNCRGDDVTTGAAVTVGLS